MFQAKNVLLISVFNMDQALHQTWKKLFSFHMFVLKILSTDYLGEEWFWLVLSLKDLE